jgi:hypothetical protein
MSILAAKVLENDARRHNARNEPRTREIPVQVFDARHGFWRAGVLLVMGPKWARVRTPRKTWKVLREYVRPL